MKKVFQKIESVINESFKTVGISKAQFDNIIDISGWVILAYIVLRMINNNSKKGEENE